MQGKDFKIDTAKLVYTIGRSEDNDIYLNSPQISHYHAQMNVLGRSRIEIEDLDSRYGTLINNRRITRQELKNGDRILIGIFALFVVGCSKGDC